ncbi:MAG: acetyl-CoA carboxylase biotin carboxylase subunit [Planctomycetes bacterium]|nr:acetyl-CoA carboxylase biotin carboxylase subunit [Planctomycetota bacterium]MCC7172881.1 acetyl-CoA carboxylase biotin carboxylase subunit [Planctomycetota bacterium]
MFKRILIANRGEIALRVIRACRELGIETVAVYSEADANAIWLRFADETICIGPAKSSQSYLDIPRIISAAEIADVEAIHPGYGFLSERAHFAEVCESCGIKFIGPPPATIDLVGNKSRAKETAKAAGVPVIPGSEGLLTDEKHALAEAHRIKYPVLIKAAAGGGGRGMRVAHNDVSLVNGYLAARAEAEAAFGDSSVYLEKLIEKPRHVEIQILGDAHGNLIHLGERDCSLQRRHQKIVEEAPSPVLDEDLRQKMGECAKRLCKAAGYVNAGTVEFLVDKDKNFYFMEVNARVQVEHPVTELVTGVDIVKEQIRIAYGERLMLKQKDVKIRGHAIECRINAEDPADNFRPCPGKIRAYYAPGGPHVRLESHAYAGYEIPRYYDSLIGKLLVWGETREEALDRMARALDEYIVEGVKTTIPLQREIMRHPRFRSGDVDTSFMDTTFLAAK